MRKLMIIMLLMFIGFNSGINISAKDKNIILIENFVDSMVPLVPEWQSVSIIAGIDIYNSFNEQIGVVYRIYNGTSQKGYILYSLDKGIIKAVFDGTDEFHKDEGVVYIGLDGVYVYGDNLKEHNLKHKENKNLSSYSNTIGFSTTNLVWNSSNIPVIKYISDYNLDLSEGIPQISNNLYSYSYYHQEGTYIDNVPDYLNELVIGGCAPTATAMLISYLDNEWHDSLTNFDSGDYDMIAEDNWLGLYRPLEAKNLINTLSDYMGTEKIGYPNATHLREWSWGLTNFMSDSPYPYYEAYFSEINPLDENFEPVSGSINHYTDYVYLINNSIPSVLFVAGNSSSNIGPYNGGHAVIGIGYYWNMYTGTGFIVQDDLTHGISYLTQDYVEYFGYIYDGREAVVIS